MKQIIDNIEAFVLTGPNESRPHWVSHFIVPTANELLVKVKTKEGVEGFGKIGRAHVRTPVTSQSRMPSSA